MASNVRRSSEQIVKISLICQFIDVHVPGTNQFTCAPVAVALYPWMRTISTAPLVAHLLHLVLIRNSALNVPCIRIRTWVLGNDHLVFLIIVFEAFEIP